MIPDDCNWEILEISNPFPVYSDCFVKLHSGSINIFGYHPKNQEILKLDAIYNDTPMIVPTTETACIRIAYTRDLPLNFQGMNLLNPKPFYSKVTDTIVGSNITFVTGGANLGKSTLCRYTINRLCSEYNTCYCIDLDPGQPLAGPVQHVSLSHFTQGYHSYSNQPSHLKTLRSIALRSRDVSDTNEIITAAVRLFLDYQQCAAAEKLCKPPLVVNFFGYEEGLGAFIINALYQAFNPSHVIRLINTKGIGYTAKHHTRSSKILSNSLYLNWDNVTVVDVPESFEKDKHVVPAIIISDLLFGEQSSLSMLHGNSFELMRDAMMIAARPIPLSRILNYESGTDTICGIKLDLLCSEFAIISGPTYSRGICFITELSLDSIHIYTSYPDQLENPFNMIPMKVRPGELDLIPGLMVKLQGVPITGSRRQIRKITSDKSPKQKRDNWERTTIRIVPRT